ncbi:GlsB/YeaQ/YmgE family stress response membrane protein [Polyangium aurulentum]|uniref:GlsB/YeaQ/YmgE family stress response membrane protein n=1 Tax=Polyangium aurulentum TaxID=2567896 RepID=UPI0010AE800F|nr:GlsB/YeaQ/YmgE family stress response membrane protein [Polyangium aurulentum]UQA57850.1 GlsB/YeaQ/YmgE family stress response membrane protein [Polyangium aurulentum]
MSIIGFLLLIVIGGLCGALAQMIVGFSAGGFIASVVVGFLGALLGTWLAGSIGLPSLLAVRVEGYTIEIFWSILGAILLLAMLSLVRRASVRRPYV